MFARLCQQNLFPHSVKKATAHILFQCFNRMTHSGLCKVQFFGCFREATRDSLRKARNWRLSKGLFAYEFNSFIIEKQ